MRVPVVERRRRRGEGVEGKLAPSSRSRTIRTMASGPNGFWMNAASGSSSPRRTISPSV